MTAVDRYDSTYPQYAPEIKASHVEPPWTYRERLAYGRHSRANTKPARRSDPRRIFRVRDAILDQVAERNVLAGVGRPVVRRSA